MQASFPRVKTFDCESVRLSDSHNSKVSSHSGQRTFLSLRKYKFSNEWFFEKISEHSNTLFSKGNISMFRNQRLFLVACILAMQSWFCCNTFMFFGSMLNYAIRNTSFQREKEGGMTLIFRRKN